MLALMRLLRNHSDSDADAGMRDTRELQKHAYESITHRSSPLDTLPQAFRSIGE